MIGALLLCFPFLFLVRVVVFSVPILSVLSVHSVFAVSSIPPISISSPSRSSSASAAAVAASVGSSSHIYVEAGVIGRFPAVIFTGWP